MAQPTANVELNASIQLLITSVSQIKTKLDSVDSRLDAIAALQTQVNTLTKETEYLKKTINNLDQEARCKTVRIIGLAISEADIKQHGQDKAIMKKAYDKLIKPILAAAKVKGEIETIPVLLNVLEQGRFAGRGVMDQQGRSLPPICSVSFTNRFLRNVVMRYKKDNIPSPTDAERAAGINRFAIVEDLTSVNAKRLKEYRDDSRVSRAWTVDGRIRFVLAASPDVIRKASSPFISAADIIDKITC
jgi:hypothetical protein